MARKFIGTNLVTDVGGNYVDSSTNQIVAGIKTFNSSPIVPTESIEDDSNKVASTAFVHDCIDGIGEIDGGTYSGS